jgi:hypothetical protein
MPTKRFNANPESGSEPTSQTPGDQDPTTATCGNLTLTLSEPSQQTGAVWRTVVREDSAVVTCCAHVRSGGIIIGARRGCPRKDLGALSL